MTDRKLFGPERKPWEDPADDRLAPSSYAAVATFGLAEMAVEHIHSRGWEVTGSRVGQYAQIFAYVLITVQMHLGEGGGWSSSLNTRLRGALRTALEVNDYDLSDQDTPEESLGAWEERLIETVENIARTAAWLYAQPARKLARA